MRYATDHNDETRERILEAASRLFRQHGIAAVGLAKIMAAAGLTVGTFYTHFKSKEAVLQEALVRSLDARHEELGRTLQGADLEVVVRTYLSPEHRDASGTGCPIAALASEVARHPRQPGAPASSRPPRCLRNSSGFSSKAFHSSSAWPSFLASRGMAYRRPSRLASRTYRGPRCVFLMRPCAHRPAHSLFIGRS